MKYVVKNKLVSVFMKQKSSSQSNIQNGLIVPGPGVTRAAAGWRVQALVVISQNTAALLSSVFANKVLNRHGSYNV